MKKHIINIRRGVFETNSSSMHSISICDDNNLHTVVHSGDGVLVVENLGFDWGQTTHSDFIAKLSYLTTYLTCCINSFDYFDEDGNITAGGTEALEDEPLFYKLLNVLENYAGVTDIEVKNTYYGYIDHQSVHVAEDMLNDSEEEIANYLFNPHSVLEISNDNM